MLGPLTANRWPGGVIRPGCVLNMSYFFVVVAVVAVVAVAAVVVVVVGSDLCWVAAGTNFICLCCVVLNRD